MPDKENLQLQQQQQQIQAAPQQEQVLQNEQKNLVLREAQAQRLQTEQAAPAEETQLEEQANETLTAQIRQEASTVQAGQTAEGAPVQEQEPAPSTWKERRKERKKAEVARKASPVGTAVTYDIVEQLKERDKMTDNSLQPYLKQIAMTGLDKECLKVFCQGYRKNRFGFPATGEDKKRKQEDEQFLKDFLSLDRFQRFPHMERIVDEIIEIQFSPDMFTTRNLRHNMKELKYIAERISSIDRLNKMHPDYFWRLKQSGPYRWRRLIAACEMGRAFTDLLDTYCQAHGADLGANKYIDYKQVEAVGRAQEDLDYAKEDFQSALEEYKRKCAD